MQLEKKENKRLKEWLEAVVVAVVVSIIMYYLCWPVRIQGSSMESTVFQDDRVFISRVAVHVLPLGRGAIVVCDQDRTDERSIIKRVIGLPGDHVVISESIVYVNGEAIDEPYARTTTAGNFDLVVPEGEYFVLGDNRHISLDSRYFGTIKKSEIIGAAFMRFYPFTQIKILH